jgi:hypothetical protein
MSRIPGGRGSRYIIELEEEEEVSLKGAYTISPVPHPR